MSSQVWFVERQAQASAAAALERFRRIDVPN